MSEHSIRTRALTEKHFHFLNERYGFEYNVDENTYSSEKMCIYIASSRLEPVIEIWLKSEPDYTKMNFKWFINLLEQMDLLRTYNLKNSLEKNFAYFANLLEKHISKIINEDSSLLLNVLQLFFESSQRNLRMTTDQLNNSVDGYKVLYDYIKSKEPGWNP